MIPKDKKPTPLLDLCIKGKKDAVIVNPAIIRDLEPPLIVLSDQQREAFKDILGEERK